MSTLTRRIFLTTAPAAALAAGRRQPPPAPLPDTFPAQPTALVLEMVSVSHGNLARVKELVAERPALARAAWDWGFGDWETALGAAAHVGNRAIAELLLAHGAPPTIFSAAMLGQLEAVKALVAAQPGVQRALGPHGITLLSHAKAGGAAAAAVVAFLEGLGDADRRHPSEALDDGARQELLGAYVFGPAARDRFVVSISRTGALVMKREGGTDRTLFHHGARVFNPAGAEAVKVRFEPASGRAARVTVEDGGLRVSGTRE